MLSFQNKYEYADISVHRALAVEITSEKNAGLMIFYYGHRWFLMKLVAKLPLIFLEEEPGLLRVFINHSKLYFMQD